MMKVEEAYGPPVLINSKSWAEEAGQKHLSPTDEECSHTTSVEAMKHSVWEAASPPQQEQTWKENYAAKKHEEEISKNKSTIAARNSKSRLVPRFVVVE